MSLVEGNHNTAERKKRLLIRFDTRNVEYNEMRELAKGRRRVGWEGRRRSWWKL